MGKILKNSFPVVLFAVSIVIFSINALKGIGSPSFGDESGHMLGAFSIVRGDILYKDYVDAHGPLIYMASWIPALFVGFHYAYALRIVPIAGTLLAALAIFYSPLFKNCSSRFLGVAFWLGGMGFFWVAQGFNMDSYWTLGGDLLAIILASSVLPTIFGISVGRRLCVWSGVSLIFLCLTAYSFAPSALLLFAALCFSGVADIKKTIFYTVFGTLCAGIIFLIWMFFHGDITGYIAYHFILNQVYYSKYISFGFTPLFHSLVPSFSPEAIINTLGTLSFYIGVFLLFLKARFYLPAVLTVLALLLTQIRGGVEFQDGTFVAGSVALLALVLACLLEKKVIFLAMLTLACWGLYSIGQRHAVFSPYGMSAQDMKKRGLHLFRENSSVGFVKVIRKYSNDNERLLVIPYNPDVYIYAGRLPMEKYHEYLPWEADYARHPWGGHDRDMCQDLLHNPPPVIYFDHYKVWGKWDASDYIPCLKDVLEHTYQQDDTEHYLYIRKDRLMSGQGHK